MAIQKIGFGGGCHWCTEAVFQAVEGVIKVDQGWIASKPPFDTFSEAVVVYFDDTAQSLSKLIDIHLATHSSLRNHSFRNKYRSAIYYFNKETEKIIKGHLDRVKKSTPELVTLNLAFEEFKRNHKNYLDYYRKNPQAPFCKTYIEPKLKVIETL